MIINETKTSLKDLNFIAKKRNGNVTFFNILRVLIALCGIYLIAVDIRILQREASNQALVFLVLGILLLSYALLIGKVKTIISFKKVDFTEKRRYKFLDDRIEILSVNDGKKEKININYVQITNVYEGNDSLYLQVLLDNNEACVFPIHDDGYKNGTKDELIDILCRR